MKKIIHFLLITVLLMATGFLFLSCPPDLDEEEDEAVLVWSDEFDGDTLDTTKWFLVPEWDRQDRSSWRNDMVEVKGGYLHIKFRRDTALGAQKSTDTALVNNWIRGGGVRTRSTNSLNYSFRNGFGYYEARIKFPMVRGAWGAFWLMYNSNDANLATVGGEEGTEIDIIESIDYGERHYNSALHWNGYPSTSVSSKSWYNGVQHRPSHLPDIYDGEFHTFAVNWTETEYVFYVDGIESWRVDGGPDFKNCGINQAKNYIKLTTEGASFAGILPADFTEDAMIVDYVRVYDKKP